MDHAPRDRETPRKPFNVLLTEQQAEWLAWLSRQRDVSKGGVLREALRRMHEQERAAFVRRLETKVS